MSMRAWTCNFYGIKGASEILTVKKLDETLTTMNKKEEFIKNFDEFEEIFDKNGEDYNSTISALFFDALTINDVMKTLVDYINTEYNTDLEFFSTGEDMEDGVGISPSYPWDEISKKNITQDDIDTITRDIFGVGADFESIEYFG